MRIKRCLGPILLLVAAVPSSARAGENSAPDPARLRQHLLESVENLPFSPDKSYSLEGRFILKATGGEIAYRARYARAADRWAADFSREENRSCDVRYVLSGDSAWTSSPEITLDTDPAYMPYMARMDFFLLFEDLLRILQKEAKDPRFAVETKNTEIYIRGTLRNGWEAVYILNAGHYFPRKVRITMVGAPAPSWLLAFSRPDGSGYSIGPSGQATEFEVWFSDPVEEEGNGYARRTDFAEHGNIVGTFLLEGITPFQDRDDLFSRPARFPWDRSLKFAPRSGNSGRSLYGNAPDFKWTGAGTEQEPWAEWSRINGGIAFWTRPVLGAGSLIPGAVSFRTVRLAVLIGFLCFVFLLVRRHNRLHRKFSWKLFSAGCLAGCLILAAGAASRLVHSAKNRSLLALHAALRYSVSGDAACIETSRKLLEGLEEALPASVTELGSSCQAYAAAYDLIRQELPDSRRSAIETSLFKYAKPLFGASRGWISNLEGSGTLAAGLGMIGLAIGCEPFVASAEEVIGRTLDIRLDDGLFPSGPGQGGVDMNSSVNFFYGLKRAERADYYSHPSFRKYVRTALQMISPIGTLPLFGDTNLDQSADLSMFFIKTANQVPEREAGRCIAAYNRYWDYGQYRAAGLMRWILPAIQPAMVFYENPYALLEYTRPVPAGNLPYWSAVLGNGQTGILRTGNTPDSAYLALYAPLENPANARRDILTFDLYAYRGLLLHGAGSPGKDRPQYREVSATAAANAVTLNDESQVGTRSSGIEAFMINQPVFDYVRASADEAYEYGRIRREIVLVRPEYDRPAYFLLIDTVGDIDSETDVQWRLHGCENLASGIGQTARWTCTAFSPSGWRPGKVGLEASYPIGFPGRQISTSGTLYSGIPVLDRESGNITIEWNGARRLATVLFPYRNDAGAVVETLGENTGRVENTDWISLGDLDSQTTVGSLMHSSELAVVRDRSGRFPALLLVSGTDFRFGRHSLAFTKPLTVSLDGLEGQFDSTRPDTRVEIRSPEINRGDTFELDGQMVEASESGSLTLVLQEPGMHTFRRSRYPFKK